MEENDLPFALSMDEVCSKPMFLSICIRFHNGFDCVLAFGFHDKTIDCPCRYYGLNQTIYIEKICSYHQYLYKFTAEGQELTIGPILEDETKHV